MKSVVRRRALAVLAAVAVASLTMQPASAAGTITLTWTGIINVPSGLGTSCTAGAPDKTCPPAFTTAPGVRVTPYPPTPGTTPTVTVEGTAPNKKAAPLWRTNGNTRGFAANNVTCIHDAVQVNKQNKPPQQAGTCRADAAGLVTGYCDVFWGTADALVRDVQGTTEIWANLTFSGIAGLVIIRGNWWKGTADKPATGVGDVTGTLTVTPDPTVANNSCVNKTARVFNASGSITLKNPKILP